jgi:hypothetical protein
MRATVRRALRCLPVVTIAVVTAGLFAPSEARSECGDYIVYTNPAHGKPMADHGSTPVKCHGPNCSQAPAPAPMPQVPPSLRILADQTIPLTDGQSVVPPDVPSFAFDAADASPIRRATDIYHPPR